MKVSELWLREWVNPALDRNELAQRLTMAGLEVDGLNPVAPPFTNVIVAKIIATIPHPQADKLRICDVQINVNDDKRQIVCGAHNARAGLMVALAQDGASLPNGIEISTTKLRGELSQGMLCSAAELGLLRTSDGILELADDAPIGQSLRDYLGLEDYIFDLDITPNRADCLSMLGIAREISALTSASLTFPSESITSPQHDERLNVQILAEKACPAYYGQIICDIDPSKDVPLWMSERLIRAGIRPIHPVVDITNYVMLEFGQPLHAYDLERLELQKPIEIRYAKPAESLKLLDGQLLSLNDKALVIASGATPIALAGVMGGANSAVSEQTSKVLLESAFFTPLSISPTVRHHHLHSEASQRFERGVDPQLQALALERATYFMTKYLGGVAGPIFSKSNDNQISSSRILFNPSKVKQLTGLVLAHETIAELLQGLGLTVAKTGEEWEVEVPSYRFDLTLDVDLVEEVIRVYGYDKLPAQNISNSSFTAKMDSLEPLTHRLSAFFISRGYHETMSYSFVDPELQSILYPEAETIQLLNPLSSELSEMRTGFWPGLLASMVYNSHRQQTAIKLFEHGVVFESQQGKIIEHDCIAGLVVGTNHYLTWNETARPYDFYDLKGDLQALFGLLPAEITFVPGVHSALHPGKSAEIKKGSTSIGWCGVLHPKIASELDIQDEVVLFELQLDLLGQTEAVKFKTVSKFPQIRRDLSFLVDDEVNAAQIEVVVRHAVPKEQLKSFEVFDVYHGASIAKGKKSLAIALILQDDYCTLTENEINKIMDAILKSLTEEFAITLRE